ncbi:hypothetical protein ACFSRY_09885 [Pontibacter locisalis]|uniref:Uncharacterized protein n=1 Tax=Pontibacter locisalis TaxID=1719035 RepID=A0ABW5IM23_9BACT
MEEYQMDWDAVSSCHDHWQNGDETIKQELLRVARLSLAGGIANAKLVMEGMATKFKAALVSPRIYLSTVDEVLHAHIGMMDAKSVRNPFMQLNEKPQVDNLAQRFAAAYLTGTAPENALPWLQELDRLDERVQYLVDGVCQAIVRLKLVELREKAVRLVHKEGRGLYSDLPDRPALPVEKPEESTGETGTPVITNQPHILDEQASGRDNTWKTTLNEPFKEGSKEELMQRTHGFPWNKGPAPAAAAKIHGFFVEQKVIHAIETPSSVIASLFSASGPSSPVQLLRGPGKVIQMLRWLSINDVLNAEDGLGLEDYSEDELRRFGRWLYPRFIGTFRNVDGERFTQKQLKNAANRLKYEQLIKEKWYIKMEAELKRSISIV